ncbi:phosphinothricin acetyltransferase [Blastococcus haudaquaticus]|uniref:Phosphinothricin acetyltransferase n=1 Tax=Blastococcus haudaquaticus TaxID=1938745 RepID=A0A286GS07_9ACTN|nr:phosphinothricin acetyltransferase [Blastococcus haudaquaticus]
MRDAVPADARRCAEIYAPYVRDSAISLELEAPDADELGRRIIAAQRDHAWLVLEDDDGSVTGYAYGGPYMSRAGYRWSAAVSVYLDGNRRRSGGGRALYGVLFERLAGRGIRTVLAGITVPNDASEGLHRALGFELVGTYRRVGWKQGRWHDVAWYQKDLGSDWSPPA